MANDSVAAGEVKITYLKEGQGPPLLLLHSMGVSSDAWKEVIRPLGQRFTVYAWDMPGQGDSEKPPRFYTIADYAQRAVDFMDALGIRKTPIIGNSIGATIAAEVAASCPDRVEKLVLVGCPGPESQQEGLERLALSGATLTSEGYPRPYTLKDMARSWAHPTPRIQRWLNRQRAKAGVWTMKAHVALHTYDSAKRLGLISCPTLIVYGSQDHLREKEDLILQGIRGSTSVIIPEAGHLPQIEAPQVFLQAILPFLTQGQPMGHTARARERHVLTQP